MSDRANNPIRPLYELYAEFAGNHEKAHDVVYSAIRTLLKDHHPAILLMIIHAAMQDELYAVNSSAKKESLSPYTTLLEEMIERLYLEEQFYAE